MNESNLHPYQRKTIKTGIDNPKYAFLLDMGLGKTVCTLSILKTLLNRSEVLKPLIIAPKFVVSDTWPNELATWEHLNGFTMSLIIGNPEERIAAVHRNADIYVVSRDNIIWLVEYLGRKWTYDMLIIDESSNFKNHTSKRFKAVKSILPKLKCLLELTGTPIPNGLIDLWAQMFLIDGGERLYEFKESFRAIYYHPTKALAHGAMQYAINRGAEDLIYEKIKDRCLSMRSCDYLDLPERRDIIRELYLDAEEMAAYNDFKRDKILETPEGQITAFNSSSIYGKLLQFSNGAVYDENKNWHVVHDKKLDLLEEVIEESLGHNVIVCYQFQSDLARILARFPNAVHVRKDAQIKAWKAGEIQLMVCHAESIGEGLNLQSGGHIMIWFGLTNKAEKYWQMVKRIDRPGQKYMVSNIILLVHGTSEYKVHKSILDKTYDQDKLFEALK
jgi:SNF2 family DNA or RNA helicase